MFVSTMLVYIFLTRLVGKVLVEQIFSDENMKVPHTTELLSGHLVLVSFYAVIKAEGLTYLALPLVALLSIYLFSLSKTKLISPEWNRANIGIKNIAFILFLALCAFISMYFRVYDWGGGLKKVHTDFSFYGGVADFMKQFGVESLILDPLSVSAFPYQPYHYFELWSAAAFSAILGVPALKTLMLVVYPYHIFLLLLAIHEFVRPRIKSLLEVLVLVVTVLFLTPLGALFSEITHHFVSFNIPFVSEHGIQTKMGMKLYAVQALFGIYLFYILQDQRWSFKFLLFLGTLLFVYPTTVPYGGLFLVMVWVLKLNRGSAHSYLTYKRLIVITGVLIALLCACSLIASGLNPTLSALFLPIKYVLSFAYIFIIVFLRSDLQKRLLELVALLIIIPLFLGFSINIGKRFFQIFNNPNFAQIIANFADPAFLVLSIVVINTFILSKGKLIQIFLSAFILGLYFFQGHFRAYTRAEMNNLVDYEILDVLTQSPDALFAYQRDSLDFHRTTTAWNIYYDIPYHNLRWHTDKYFPLCISLPSVNFKMEDIDDSKKQWLSSIISRSAFYKHATIDGGVLPDSADTQVESFLKKHKIHRVINSTKR